MFDYDVAVYYLGQLVDNIRVSAHDALGACKKVEEMSRDYIINLNAHEFSAKRVIVAPAVYETYFGDVVRVK